MFWDQASQCFTGSLEGTSLSCIPSQTLTSSPVPSSDCLDEDSLDEFSSKFISAEALERAYSFSESPKRLVSPKIILDQCAETLQTWLEGAAAQDQAFIAVMEQIKKDQNLMIWNRMKARQARSADLSNGRVARIHLMKKWKQEQQDISIIIRVQHSATKKLSEAIHHLPKFINKLDHLRMVEIDGHNQKEEEEDNFNLETWRKESSYLNTVFKGYRDILTEVARPSALLKDTNGKMRRHKRADKVLIYMPETPPENTIPSELSSAGLCAASEKDNTMPTPAISSESAAAPPFPSKLPPLTSKLPPLACKLPLLNPPLWGAFHNSVAPLPPIRCKAELEDLESDGERSTQSAVAEHLIVKPETAKGKTTEAISTGSSESIAAADSVFKQERKKTRSIKKRFFQFLQKLNSCGTKEE